MRPFSFLLFILLFSIPSFASHYAGGDIQYRYIGDSTGVNHHYEIILRIYLDVTGSTYVEDEVTASSSCYPDITIQMNLLPGTGTGHRSPTLFDCIPPPAPQSPLKDLDIYAYKGYVVLNGPCTDWRFWWQDFARPGGYTNANAVGGFYFEATLNNTLGNNSSPIFISEPVRSFCVGNTFNWKQTSVELDGDSIHYSWIESRTAPNAPLTYNPGFSYSQPISSTPPIQLNPQTGLITLTPTAQEVDVAALVINEFRFDTTYNQWLHIGSSNREMTVNIGPSCKQSVQDGVVLDTTADGIYYDPLKGYMVKKYACFSDSVHLVFKTPLDCESANRGDFRLTSPDGQPIPIKELEPLCDPNGDAKKMILHLFKPLALNGDYFLYSKKGNDGNTLINKCGFAMDEFDSLILRVEDCPVLNWDLQNVSIQEDHTPLVEWTWDASQIPAGIHEGYKIYRSDDNGATYREINYVQDPSLLYFEDKSFLNQGFQSLLDQNNYWYKVEPIFSGQPQSKSRGIESIVLKGKWDASISSSAITLNWNVYNGWADSEYTVLLGKKASGLWTWRPINNVLSGSNPTTSNSISISTKGLGQGEFALRVDAIDRSTPSVYVASSNWFRFKINDSTLPADPILVPNAFSPNNDGINDLFEIENIGNYAAQRSVSIFNRWGEVVYKSENYQNAKAWDGTGPNNKKLPNGVYYYRITLKNQTNDTPIVYEGHVTLFTQM